MRHVVDPAPEAPATKTRRKRTTTGERNQYPDAIVALVKGARRLMSIKAICEATGIPSDIVADWTYGKRRASVAPNEAIGTQLSAVLRTAVEKARG